MGAPNIQKNLRDAWIKLYQIWGGYTAVCGAQQVLAFRHLAPF